MGTRLTLRTPGDYVLSRDVCSYGYFLLAPNHWDAKARTLRRALDLSGGPTTVVISQGDECRPGDALRVVADRALAPPERAEARRQIARMLRLDEDESHVAAFHRVDRRWKRSGRARLFRSPTLFEDVVKTVTSCNVAWPSTVNMNRRLCEVIGRAGAFPTAERMARTRPGTLRARCRVGYRDVRLVELARHFARGDINEPWLQDPATPDDDVFDFLLTLPGIGPYAAGNIMQLLGRYSRLALDTESVRHARAVLGYDGTDAAVLRRLKAHYEPFGEHRFRSYWFELWRFYERKRGPAHTWEREAVENTFTASKL
ncbi:MAG TPA: hypothetical protein PLU35_06555 [Phycisphaerales bacterium]|nr:hypothetical protein [Phycisphaerales bacterium]